MPPVQSAPVRLAEDIFRSLCRSYGLRSSRSCAPSSQLFATNKTVKLIKQNIPSANETPVNSTNERMLQTADPKMKRETTFFQAMPRRRTKRGDHLALDRHSFTLFHAESRVE